MTLATVIGFVALFNSSVLSSEPDEARFPIMGIDVSHHQKAINWQQVAEAGVHFAYIKSSEGRDFLDTQFQQNWVAAAEAGIPRGAYHFFTFCSPGKAQAEHFLKTAPPEQLALPPVADVEFVGNCKSFGDLKDVRQEFREFLTLVEQAWGVKPILYLTPDALERVLGSDLTEYPIWIRSIQSEPRSDQYREWVLWQFSASSQINGIVGPVDHNALSPGLTLNDLRLPASD